MKDKFYKLPDLPYEYDFLEPVISAEQLRLHHDKHHKAYVEMANEILKKLDNSRMDGDEVEAGNVAKKLSFNVGGNILHTLFWQNLTKPDTAEIGESDLKLMLEEEFGDMERFRSEFINCATTIEGSGWAALTYSPHTKRFLIMQIGNHNLNLIANHMVVMVLDMWEHAYYLDYKNDKKSYAEKFWQILNWPKVEERFMKLRSLYDKPEEK